MINKIRNTFFLLGFLSVMSGLQAQYYAHGGFEYGFLKLNELNSSIEEFNTRESHTIAPVNNLQGYRIGFGRYAEFTQIEIGFGTLSKKQVSKNPNLLKETAEVLVNHTSLDAGIGFRPFKKQFHSVGATLHMGQLRYRYSFGGDYLVPVNEYNIWGEVYAEFAFKFRFIIKKEMRDKLFYVFKLRPFYRIGPDLDLRDFQRDFNLSPTTNFGDIRQSINHFGLRVSIAVPFLSKEDQEKYKLGGKEDLARKRRKLERQRKRKQGNQPARGKL